MFVLAIAVVAIAGIGLLVKQVYGHSTSGRHHAEDELAHERLYDRLTALPSRRLFVEHLEHALAHAARVGSTLAVFGVDVDGLSVVNERHGHERGDELLIRVGQDLERVLRADDTIARADAIIARFEDSFFILYEDIGGPVAAATVAERLASAVRHGEPIGASAPVAATATVGVAIGPPATSDPESLLVEAASAMHVGKGHGGDCVEFFDPVARQVAHGRAKEQDELDIAIAENQLRLLYQPQVESGSRRLRGVEALVRWQHPQRGLVLPAEFIPLAEATGLIQPLGEWVLAEACRQRARWSSLVADQTQLVMSVNVSRRQFDASFPGLVRRALEESHAPDGSLCLEVTETAVMSDVDTAIATMREIRDLNVQLSIDDFGTGYSSLAQLKRLPLDQLKIDQSFVGALGQSSDDTAIVAAIVAMARALRLSVIAEGVETVQQLEVLRAVGCELAQGYLFSPPVTAEAIDGLLSTAGL